MMDILYINSKAVKINDEMRNNLNNYNQRKNEINNYSIEISEYQNELTLKNNEMESLQALASGEDKREARDAAKKIKSLQKESDRLSSLITEIENKRIKLQEKQDASKMDGVHSKSFPEKEEIALEVQENNIGVYNEDESFVPVDEFEANMLPDGNEETKITSDDLDAIWNKLHDVDTKNEEAEPVMEKEEVAPVYEDATPIEPVYEENVENENSNDEISNVFGTPVSIFGDAAEDIKPVEISKIEQDEVSDKPNVIEPTVIADAPVVVTPEVEEEPVVIEEENNIEPEVSLDDDELPMELEQAEVTTIDNESDQDKIHRDVAQEFPEIAIPEPMDAEKKLTSIYEEVDVEPKLLDKSKTRDLKNLTLFVDYNDYTFTFAQQHYNKEALTPEEIEKLEAIKSYLEEKDFNIKRTIQYNKVTAENKRLNRKIVTLSKEFTKTIDKLSKDYVDTTDELTRQTNKAKEQIEVDRVEKVQTQKLNESLTENIKEQNDHIDSLTEENNGLKETIAARDKTIKNLQDEVKEQSAKIKVFEEKLNTVLGIVKEVKGEKKNK